MGYWSDKKLNHVNTSGGIPCEPSATSRSLLTQEHAKDIIEDRLSTLQHELAVELAPARRIIPIDQEH